MRPQKPAVGPARAERCAKEKFGIVATATELAGEVDRNFLLRTEKGQKYVMKIAPGESDPQRIECQAAALQHLEESELAPLVPRVVQSLRGELLSSIEAPDGGNLLVRVVSYLDGRPIFESDESAAELRHQIGYFLARLDRVFETFDHPGAHRPIVWDIACLLELSPLAEMVDGDLRPLVLAGLDGFSTRVLPRLGDFRTGIIHNDANDHNLLYRRGRNGRPRLAGLIDFGDMVHTITVAELAIACAYVMLGVENPQAAAAEVIAGYEERILLRGLEREALPDLIVARLCASLLLSAQARQTAPENPYLRTSEQPVAALLRRLV